MGNVQGKVDWRNFVDDEDCFILSNYLYRVVTELMKYSLDMGTLLSDNPPKLRAYKEQVKNTFKAQWFDLAEALVEFDMVIPCGCSTEDFCERCAGSRYLLNRTMAPDVMNSIVVGHTDVNMQHKLQQGLEEARRELE